MRAVSLGGLEGLGGPYHCLFVWMWVCGGILRWSVLCVDVLCVEVVCCVL